MKTWIKFIEGWILGVIIGLGIAAFCCDTAHCQTHDYATACADWATAYNVTHPTAGMYCGGSEPSTYAGFVDWYVQMTSAPEYKRVFAHVPTAGAYKLTVFVGDSITELMQFEVLAPDLPTVNLGIGGAKCVPDRYQGQEVGVEALEMPIAVSLSPQVIVAACGTNDLFDSVSPASIMASLSSMASSAHAISAGFVVSTVTPIRPLLQTEPHWNPAVYAQDVRTFNALLRKQGWGVWDRWLNIVQDAGNYGQEACYEIGPNNLPVDGIHPVYCQQEMFAGVRYQIGEAK